MGTWLLDTFLILLFVHWFADFVLQTHWQAQNKSKRLDALLRHVGVYTMVLLFSTPFILSKSGYQVWFLFTVVNGVLHLATDFVTSKITSHLYAKKDYHNFFVVVGIDQFIHQATLALTLMWLVK